MKKKLLPILISLFIVSCKHQTTDTCFSENNNTYIPANIETIHPTGKLVIDSLIGIGNIEVVNKHLCLFTSSNDSLFSIYNFDGEFLTAFGKRGQGPSDFTSTRMNGNKGIENGQEFLWINDVNSSSLKRLNLTQSVEKSLCVVDSIIPILPMSINAFLTKEGNVVQEVMTPNNFELVTKKGDDIHKENIYKKDTPHPFSMYKSTMRMDTDSQLLFFSMVAANQINIMDLSCGKRSSICIGEYTDVEEIIDKDTNTEKWVYYVDLRVTPNYIFALYMNQNYQDSYAKEKPVEIHLFNKKGIPLKIIQLNEYIKNICITEDEMTIFGLNNDHSIYKYELTL